MQSALTFLLSIGLSALVSGQAADPAEPVSPPPTAPAPHFQEVLRLLRGNLQGVTEEELNRAMVDGLLDHFRPRVQLAAEEAEEAEEVPREDVVRRTGVYDQTFGYIGVRAVDSNLAGQVSAALESLQSSNQLEGLVLDLRAAGGTAYPAAAEAASLFVDPGQPLIHWDAESLTSTPPGGIGLPIAVLVNAETAGAAEALAGALQATGPTVVIGSRTAGRAYAMKRFSLESGQDLRIAGAPVLVGEDRSLAEGVVPDLVVSVTPGDERVWLEDPYQVLAGSTNSGNTTRMRLDEAELVRRHEGLTNPPVFSDPVLAPVAVTPPIQDQALARALAVLKGLVRVRGGIRR